MLPRYVWILCQRIQVCYTATWQLLGSALICIVKKMRGPGVVD